MYGPLWRVLPGPAWLKAIVVLLVLVGIAVLYMLLRNLPMFWFLAPISYVGG